MDKNEVEVMVAFLTTPEQKAWLKEQARLQKHNSISAIVRQIIAAAMDINSEQRVKL